MKHFADAQKAGSLVLKVRDAFSFMFSSKLGDLRLDLG